MICPCQEGREETDGDVVVPQLVLYRFPTNPDPTARDSPKNLYEASAVLWTYTPENIGEDIFEEFRENELRISSFSGIAYQGMGAQITGQQIKGPAEAEGYNVDLFGMPFSCGGVCLYSLLLPL